MNYVCDLFGFDDDFGYMIFYLFMQYCGACYYEYGILLIYDHRYMEFVQCDVHVFDDNRYMTLFRYTVILL